MYLKYNFTAYEHVSGDIEDNFHFIRAIYFQTSNLCSVTLKGKHIYT